MHCFQNQVVGVGDERLFAPCICTPQEIDDGCFALVEMTDDAVGQLLPAFALVAVGLTTADCQYGVEEKDALFRPFHKIGIGVFNAQIGFDFLENIHKRRWCINTWKDGEAHTMGLVWAVIGILTDDDNLYVLKSSMLQGIEYIVHIWINSVMSIFVRKKTA